MPAFNWQCVHFFNLIFEPEKRDERHDTCQGLWQKYSESLNQLKNVKLVHKLALICQRSKQCNMNAGNALVDYFENNGEESDEPEVACEFACNCHSCYMRNIVGRLLLSLVFWEGAN